MQGDIDLYGAPLTALTYEARNLLTCLLNTTKILPSEGPDRLLRDWRGLATLINISTEIANSFESRDKTAKVLEYWIQKRDGTATVGRLLEYVQRLDRYDIFDDFMSLCSGRRLILTQPTRPPQDVARIDHAGQLMVYRHADTDDDIITFDDKIHGAPQFYHAYILYAQEDRDFVMDMIIRMRDRGYKLCTEEDLLPNHATTYTPVSRLISSDRCHRIILVYSPDFLVSSANNFYMDYAQAVGIEMKRPKIIPCMYRNCVLPPQVTFYHKLYYNPPGARNVYDFWDRLGYSLDVHNPPPRLNGTTSSSISAINITEITATQTMSSGSRSGLLALPSTARYASTNGIDHLRTNDTEVSTISTASAGSHSAVSQGAGSQSAGSQSPGSQSAGSQSAGSQSAGSQNGEKKKKSKVRKMISSLKFWKKKEATN